MRKTLGINFIALILGVLIGSAVVAVASPSQDRVPVRAESQQTQKPRAIWYMHVGQDTVGAVIVDIGELCKPRP